MGPSPHFSASLEDLPLGIYLASFLHAKRSLVLLEGAEGESLAKALARFPAPPSAVALALSALAEEGTLAFDPPSASPSAPESRETPLWAILGA